jgi:hypothetical protein
MTLLISASWVARMNNQSLAETKIFNSWIYITQLSWCGKFSGGLQLFPTSHSIPYYSISDTMGIKMGSSHHFREKMEK